MAILFALMLVSISILLIFTFIKSDISWFLRVSLFSLNTSIVSVTFIFTLITYKTVNGMGDNIKENESDNEMARRETTVVINEIKDSIRKLENDIQSNNSNNNLNELKEKRGFFNKI